MAWPPVTHQDVQDAVTALRAAPPAHMHPVTDVQATGTRSTTTFLRGDGTWATPPGSTSTSTANASILEALVFHDGTTGGGTRPSGYGRVKWVGGTARPTNMVAGDIWEHDAA